METFPVRYERKGCDLADFLNHHPGGVNYLQPYKNKDVYQRMCDTGHSKAAHYLLREYKLDKCEHLKDDSDLEYLIDWSKPVLSQIGSLGHKYREWVTSPVVREIRLFDNALLEQASVTPWYAIPLLWLPLSSYYLYKGYCSYLEASLPDAHIAFPILLHVAFGTGLWTFFEYLMHRWIFHFMPDGSSKLLLYLHFLLHGLHHKAPFDSRRLVFPPVLALPVLYIVYHVFAVIWPRRVMYLILGGYGLGYIIYDLMHYYLHNGNPDGGYWYYMKRYHYQHHFAHHDSAFGVSNPVWDVVFGTFVKLRKLSMRIKWFKGHQ